MRCGKIGFSFFFGEGNVKNRGNKKKKKKKMSLVKLNAAVSGGTESIVSHFFAWPVIITNVSAHFFFLYFKPFALTTKNFEKIATVSTFY